METETQALSNTGAEKLELTAIVAVGILNPDELEFFRSPYGFLHMKQGGTEHKHIILRRMLPFSQLDEYISVANREQEEIGILRDLSLLSPEQALLLREELFSRYYCPAITQIHSMKDKMGYVYAEVSLGEHRRAFALKDVSKNIRRHGDSELMLFDVDGNRYRIPDIRSLDKKSMRRLETYLF